ncbi:MAG: nicotinate-nucleotide adenylyltransferase [Eubacteriales bacterium]|nr:nicotinate-nucleotide adenylyltransferase [Eubacteriales bacterium]
MKIGIMGGTFDPIHNGHLMLGEYAYREYDLDKVWFMPNGNPPHKQNTGQRTDAKDRAEMVRLAIDGTDAFCLEKYELNRTDISYSYQTMEYFKERYPEDHFYFIIGADSLFSLEKWVHPERIFRTCTLLAAYRDEMNSRDIMETKIAELNHKYHSDIRLLITPLLHVSSHELRSRIQEGQSISAYVPESVERYIIDHRLYLSNC